MTVHYHGTPITPLSVLNQMAGAHFCVSHWRPDQIRHVHRLGQSVMLDNGAFSAWRAGNPIKDWSGFYSWCDYWLDCPTTWAVIPDEIDGGSAAQGILVSQWPFGDRGVAVWHMDEPVARLLQIVDDRGKVCFGSSGKFRTPLSSSWRQRCDEAWDALSQRHQRTPWVHMLRGMQCAGLHWPFASVDSTDVARNHNRGGSPVDRTERWDARQCADVWLFGRGRHAK